MTTQIDFAYRFIKEKIVDGTYKPAQKLIESELSSIIDVSRNTMKKALLKLESENLVEAIKSQDESKVKDAVSLHISNVRKTIEENFHLLM